MEKDFYLGDVLKALQLHEWNMKGQYLTEAQKNHLKKFDVHPRRWTCFMNNSVEITAGEIRTIAKILDVSPYVLLMTPSQIKAAYLEAA